MKMRPCFIWEVVVCHFLAGQTVSIPTVLPTSVTDSFLSLKEQSWRLVTVKTFDQSDEGARPDQLKSDKQQLPR